MKLEISNGSIYANSQLGTMCILKAGEYHWKIELEKVDEMEYLDVTAQQSTGVDVPNIFEYKVNYNKSLECLKRLVFRWINARLRW